MLSLDEFNDLVEELIEEVKLYDVPLSEDDVRELLFWSLERTSISHSEINELTFKR